MSMDDGESGQVQNMSYCLKKSFNARNVDEMTEKLGYKDLSDLANCPQPPTPVRAAKSNPQIGPTSSNPRNNDRKGKAY